ncbi:MAG TPA: hypothetical protein VE093_37270 [Polyangiaceae bacterium]|nr:hypothetical protein [Polyangiaceae bacterium]
MSWRTPRRLARGIPIAAAAILSCGGPPRIDAPFQQHPPAAAERPSGAGRAARYLVPDSAAWVERTPEGLDRIVANGCRIEARGAAIERIVEGEPEVEGGYAMPAWTAPPATSGGRVLRYLFWKDKELYGAESFLAPLTPIASLRTDIKAAFDWLDGAGLLTGDGVSLVRAAAGSVLGEVGRFPVPGAVSAVAVDARRALALTTFGHARLTQDGGSTYRDASAELPSAIKLEVRGQVLAATLEGDRRKFIASDGAISDSLSTEAGPKRGARPPDLDDKWPPSAPIDPLDALVNGGVALDDGSVLVAARGVAGRLDAASGRASSAAELPEGFGECAPVRLPGEILLVCKSNERATVVELAGSPRVERTFDLAHAADLDRFAASDGEGLGFLGPCDGSPPRAPPMDVVSSATPYNASMQRSSVFCARKSRSEWIEHRLDPADATDVIAWIPRPSGGAVALVARPGTFLDNAERVQDRGLLRVVRLARGEPPLAVPQYGERSPQLLTRSLRASPGGEVEGWLPSTTYPSNLLAVVINAQGLVRVRPLPSQPSAIATAGAFGMVQTEDGRLFETTDWGESFTEVEGPPGNPLARLTQCSPAGCRIGPFVRLGWSGGADPKHTAAAKTSASPVREALQRELALRAMRDRQYRRPSPLPPLVSLTCGFASAGEGARVFDSYAFGFAPSPAQRGQMPTRIGSLGTMHLPWNGSQIVTSGDAEIAWVPLLDLDAPVRRATTPLAKAGTDMKHRLFEVRLGYVIDPEGRVSAISVGSKEACLAGLLDEAGLTKPSGGCAPEASVGVDLGGRMVLLNARYGAHTLLAVDAPASSQAGLAQRELGRTPVALGAHGYLFGVGSRNGAPVAVALDGRGDAVLSPIDDARGVFGPEERLAPLPSARLGSDPACAPRPDQARVVLPFESAIGLDRAAMPGVYASGSFGLAVLRWSASEACLDAIELSVRDERYEIDVSYYEPPGTLRKLIARFGPKGAAPPSDAPRSAPRGAAGAQGHQKAPGAPLPKAAGNATLALILHGAEVRQRLQCSGIRP